MMTLPILGMVVAIVANVVLGSLWYSPLLFGNLWAKATFPMGMSECKPTPLHFVGAILVAIVTVTAIAILFHLVGIASLEMALKVGGIVWLIMATSHFSGVIWSKKPLVTFFVDVSYLLVNILVVSSVLVLLK